jgi:hypothetical protein
MKKLMVLMLVLGMASVANAVLVLDISVNGDTDPRDSDIILCAPSGEVILDIYCSSGYDAANPEDDQYWALVTDLAYGSISNGNTYIPPAPSMSAILGTAGLLGIPVPAGYDGPAGAISGSPGETAPPGVYFDDFIFHCEAVGDATIQLWTTPDGVTMTLQDTLIIHQVPEPMTITLLGLGGLLMLRRRK